VLAGVAKNAPAPKASTATDAAAALLARIALPSATFLAIFLLLPPFVFYEASPVKPRARVGASGEGPLLRQDLGPIHRSAWKGYSRNFALMGF
jgi:hypothetical protein